MDKPLRIDRTITLGTLIGVMTFSFTVVGGIVGGTVVFTKLQAQTEFLGSLAQRQEQRSVDLDKDRAAAKATYDTKIQDIGVVLNKLMSFSDKQSDQISQLQKKEESDDARMSRISESSGDKFTEIQSALADIKTQIALANQTITELKQIISQYPSASQLQGLQRPIK